MINRRDLLKAVPVAALFPYLKFSYPPPKISERETLLWYAEGLYVPYDELRYHRPFDAMWKHLGEVNITIPGLIHMKIDKIFGEKGDWEDSSFAKTIANEAVTTVCGIDAFYKDKPKSGDRIQVALIKRLEDGRDGSHWTDYRRRYQGFIV
jgi:hypothetical protein